MRLDVSARKALGLTAPAGVDWSDSSRLVKPEEVGLVVLEVDCALSERLAVLTNRLALSLAAVVGSLRHVVKPRRYFEESWN